MALWENCRNKLKECGVDAFQGPKQTCVVRRMGSMGRKRVEPMCVTSPSKIPWKKQCGVRTNSEKSQLEGLPQDVLIRILCGVDHDDLERLLHVSSTIRDATIIAKQWHFAFHTPTAKTASAGPFNVLEGDNDVETPNAPKARRNYRSRIGAKKLASITVALFHSSHGQ